MLPFGLRSAPKIFNAVADALEWSLRQRGIRQIFHYLDDFIVIGPPDSSECALALLTLDRTCAELGIPIAEHKREGPVTCLTFLGIEVDTVAMQLRLPLDKLRRLQGLLSDWGDKKTCERRELESLIGLLNHACKVVRCGRSFLRRMLDLLLGVPMPRTRPHPIRLNRAFRSDLSIRRGLERGFFPHPTTKTPAAADGLGCVGLMGMRSLAQPPMVSAPMGSQVRSPYDHSEGAPSHCPGLRCLGPRMGQPPHRLPL